MRLEMRAKRRAIDPAWAASAGVAVQERVVGLDAFAGASAVACYIAMRTEVSLDAVITRCRSAGKTVAVPAWRRESGAYGMARLEPGATLVPGLLGIMEPAFPDWIASVDMVLVPGVAFDAAGGRLGRGGGYYDRILAEIGDKALRVGVAFDFQVVARVPVDRHDVRMDAVVTETKVLQCRTGAAG